MDYVVGKVYVSFFYVYVSFFNVYVSFLYVCLLCNVKGNLSFVKDE